MIEYLIVGAGLAALAAVLWFRRGPPDRAEGARLAASIADVAAATQAQQRDLASLLEAARGAQQTAASLAESLAAERAQVGELKAGLAAAAQGLTEVKQLQGSAGAALAEQVQQARQELARILAENEQRAARAELAFGSLERLEMIIAGTKSRGTAGENMLAEVIKQLPAEFRAYDVRINGKTVEFAIPLPNGRVLPVDSKWTSVDKLDRLVGTQGEERLEIVREIQADVAAKVDEVVKYLTPEKTCMMAVLAVPDAVFELCDRAHVAAHKRGVVIVPYSMAVPYVLSVLQVIKRFGARTDEAQLSQALHTVGGALDALSDELEGRLSKAIVLLDNSRRDLRMNVGKAQQALGRVQVAEPGAAHGANGTLVEA